jgi:dTDP-4-amino-4,6-dideoxygalactose transaminase
MIPFLSFNYQDKLYRNQILEAMAKVLDSKWYIMGEELVAFEKEYAELHRTKFSLGVANGLDALTIALHSLGVGPGDEVVVPSNTYIASWLAVSAVGAIPIPVEPDESTYNLNPSLIVEKISNKTKAILPVHLYGQACDMTAIMEIAENYNLAVVEDNAQAHLSTWNNKLTGSFGDINATSFYPGKNLGALGDGGGITTDSEELYSKAKSYRNYGSEKKYYNEIKGINSRLDELHAAVLRVKLPYLDELTKNRQEIANKYNKLLANCNSLKIPFVSDNATHVYHLYVLMCDRRDELQAYLQSKGIGTLIHYPIPPHLQQAYKELNYKVGDFPIAENIAKRCLSLPIYPGITDAQIEEVCSEILRFYTS